MLLHAHALVFIKPDNKPGEVWIAELVEALVALIEPGGSSSLKGKGKGKGKAAIAQPSLIRMSSDSLGIRYFSPNPDSPEGGGVRFQFAYNYTLASYEAIWGTVNCCHERCFEGMNLMSFTLSEDEYERGLGLVSNESDAAPPIALQFEELLSQLKRWDGESSSDSSSDSDSSDADATGQSATVKPTTAQMRTTRAGRAVPQHNYKE